MEIVKISTKVKASRFICAVNLNSQIDCPGLATRLLSLIFLMLKPNIVSGCIGIIKSNQQLTLNHSVFPPARQQSTLNSQLSTLNSQLSTVNSQQSTLNNSGMSATGTDITSPSNLLDFESEKS
ncbi:hypothetical protein [Tychonema sp. LEGE 07203]|uniref:hypothetical protein n=1 Tax=Tychonema sp. LEGE 07203 TaxID=1828671 RepID=UPI00187E0D74|nr:hypothetical protein [Tychonema sp. LEGE 07203]MBE9095803.1 hypothetical protein [Tychonema sp. LEGE 07203]